MRTNQHGLADRLGHYTVIQLAIVILKTRSISIRHRKYITSSLLIKICRKTSFLTGIMMLLISRMNLVMPPLQHVRLLLCMNSTAICRVIIIKKLLIKLWKASVHRLIAPKWVQTETSYWCTLLAVFLTVRKSMFRWTMLTITSWKDWCVREIWKKSKPCLTYTLAGYVHALMPSGI